MNDVPLTRELVLIGGGHSHALVLRRFGMAPVAGLSITLINPGPTAPYTGMLPGHIAGHYDRAALEIDLYRLARFAGGRLLTDSATAIDTNAKTIDLKSGRRISYDVASFDIGVTSDLPALPGAEHGVAAKPLGPLARRWRAFIDSGGAEDVVVIGGGVAGAELALAMAHRLRALQPSARVTIIERGTALAALPQRPAKLLRARLASAAITLVENADVAGLTEDAVLLSDGPAVPSTFTVTASGARPFDWLAGTGLALQNGYIAVNARLQTSDASVFAAGDCAHLTHAPRPKAGVYAVRAAPILEANLKAAVTGGPMKRFDPQRDYLKLISLGGKEALGEKFGITMSGKAVWRLKDRIDQKFMAGLNHLSPMRPVRSKGLVAKGAAGAPMLCGGCGGKVSAGALNKSLGLIGDDAAVRDIGGVQQVISTDHLSAFTGDPHLMARIAALHAMGDIWAMGGTPETALTQITLPRMSEPLQARWMVEITAGARAAFDTEKVEIIGGHTTQGANLQIGFTILGRVDGDPVRNSGAKAGDELILTRPIGSGVLLAADMALMARGDNLTALFKALSEPQSEVAKVCRRAGACAMTDVTGFGLAGHLANILNASGLAAELYLEAIPVFDGALEAARAGIRSSLWEANRAAVALDAPQTPKADLLCDPQTAGGFLVAIDPEAAKELMSELQKRGQPATRIGRLVAGVPAIKAR